MEHVQHVQGKWPNVQHVLVMEVNARNAIQSISLNQQRNVQPVQARRIVKPVRKQLINVRNVNQEIIPVEQDVLHVQR